DAPEHAAAVVHDRRGLSVHGHVRAAHGAAIGQADRLVTETDAEQGRLPAEAPDDVERDACALGPARSRRDEDPGGLHLGDVADRPLVVPFDTPLGAELPQVVDEVVRERIVVVDHENHGATPSSAGRISGCGAASEDRPTYAFTVRFAQA